jgi:FKBP-type peptidyl-prolyl cis-trans isomerase
MGYGDEGSPPTIEPNEVLVFEIELVGSQPGPKR